MPCWLQKRSILRTVFERDLERFFEHILVAFLYYFCTIFVRFSASLGRAVAPSKIAPLWYENLIFAIPARLI